MATSAKKDYKAIGARTIVKPSEMAPSYNFLIYSRAKKGKSTFGESASELAPVLILDPEGGTKTMKE